MAPSSGRGKDRYFLPIAKAKFKGYFNRVRISRNLRANNTNSVLEFVLFPYGAEKRMFCGCALKASAAEGVAEESGGEEAPCCLARPPENTGFLISSQRNKKARTRRTFAGAEKRIRTSGRVTPVTRFPIVLLKPLRHLCRNNSYFTTNPPKMQLLFMRFCHFSRTNSEFIPMAESAF